MVVVRMVVNMVEAVAAGEVGRFGWPLAFFFFSVRSLAISRRSVSKKLDD
jgi:hypothetical protein